VELCIEAFFPSIYKILKLCVYFLRVDTFKGVLNITKFLDLLSKVLLHIKNETRKRMKKTNFIIYCGGSIYNYILIEKARVGIFLFIDFAKLVNNK
jgi:hypothetical protein